MALNKTLVAVTVAIALLSACKQEAAPPVETQAAAEASTQPAAQATPSTEAIDPVADTPSATDDPTAPAAPAVAAFDINAIPLSDQPLPAWPYITLPAGYELDDADDIAGNTKDLARVPAWTGGQLLWVEGKVFSDGIDNSEGKTFSKFELRKNLQQSIEALGGVRLSERAFGRETYKASEKDLEDFRREYNKMRDAYWYDADADTYLVRRADKAIWLVLQLDNNDAAVMVAEGPLPEAPQQ